MCCRRRSTESSWARGAIGSAAPQNGTGKLKKGTFNCFSNYYPIALGKCQIRRCFTQQVIFLSKIKVSLSLSGKLIAIAMYHGENAFTLSWRQLWGCNSPSGYKNKFSARVVIISASVSFFLCSKRIESPWQGLQISKHRGILSLSPQGLTFMCLHSCVLSPFPLLQKLDPHERALPMAEVFSPPCPPHQWEGVVRSPVPSLQSSDAPGWVSALQGSCMNAGRRDVHMALLESGKDGLSPPGGKKKWGKKKKQTTTKLVLSEVFWGICLICNTHSL